MNRRIFLLFTVLFAVSGCATTGNEAARKKISYKQEGSDVVVVVDNSILFDLAEFSLRSDASAVLDLLVSDSLSRTKKDLVVEGHTDIRGIEANNDKLSKQRAESVKAGLVSRGILASRIKTEGLGSKRLLVVDAKAESEHEQNRRAVIRIRNERVENVRSTTLEDAFDSVVKSLGLK